MIETHEAYLPAAGHDLLLPFYDSFTKLLGLDRARRSLVEKSELRAGLRVLEIGCGTGGVLVAMKRSQPGIEAVGLDPDPKALARARRKAERAGVSLTLDRGFAQKLDYRDASFDRVLSSFMFHHLEPDQKTQMLAEVRRVLKDGGRFEMVDFAGPRSGHGGRLARLFHAHERLADNDEGSILAQLRSAHFADARVTDRERTLLGGIVYYRAC